MIEIEIPADIKEYEPKVLGPFSSRQIIGIIGIAVTSIVGYNILNLVFDNGLRFLIPLFLDLPWVLFAYYKPYGMKFEDYFKSQLYTTIIPPKRRLYKVENLYQQIEDQIEEEINPNYKKKKKGGRK